MVIFYISIDDNTDFNTKRCGVGHSLAPQSRFDYFTDHGNRFVNE